MNNLDHCNTQKRRKRILTDARKEQNRVAQRAYRQRMKENIRKTARIQNVFRLIRPNTGKEGARLMSITSRPTEQESISNVDNNDVIQHTDIYQVPKEFEWMQEPNLTQVEEVDPGQRSVFPIAPYSDSNMPPIWDSVSIQRSWKIPDLEGDQISNASVFQMNCLDLSDPGCGPQTFYAARQPTRSSSAIERNGESQHEKVGDSLIWSLDQPSSAQALPLYHEDPSYIPKSDNNNNTNTNTNKTNRSANSGGLSYGINAQTIDITNPPSLPCPTTTNLWFPQPVLLTAGLHNAISLNIAYSSVLTASSLSPFYHPSILPSDDPIMLLSHASKLSTPPHLKPTLAQILFPHHPWIDLLPFTVLRERAITLAATSPKMFDLMDLKKDIIGDGLRFSSCMGHGCTELNGRPWDGRSWEVAPWFLRKWRMLMVGVDGKFW